MSDNAADIYCDLDCDITVMKVCSPYWTDFNDIYCEAYWDNWLKLHWPQPVDIAGGHFVSVFREPWHTPGYTSTCWLRTQPLDRPVFIIIDSLPSDSGHGATRQNRIKRF